MTTETIHARPTLLDDENRNRVLFSESACEYLHHLRASEVNAEDLDPDVTNADFVGTCPHCGTPHGVSIRFGQTHCVDDEPAGFTFIEHTCCNGHRFYQI
ncbi:hypothetical protein [Mycobacteroides abscessus]|uniref:hypothetical protein n=1 Tax=Mycobacteroides abscessus TaxID=36809 RepID=UPI000C25943F|nr:hypothetical protein [Mycobacteroides abscessus]